MIFFFETFILLNHFYFVASNLSRFSPVVLVRFFRLEKIIQSKLVSGNFFKFFEIFPHHCDIAVIIPWDESLMSDTTQKCSIH